MQNSRGVPLPNTYALCSYKYFCEKLFVQQALYPPNFYLKTVQSMGYTSELQTIPQIYSPLFPYKQCNMLTHSIFSLELYIAQKSLRKIVTSFLFNCNIVYSYQSSVFSQQSMVNSKWSMVSILYYFILYTFYFPL